MSNGSSKNGAKGPGQFNEYAAHYDLLYKDKDYAEEAQYISGLIRNHTTKKTRGFRILDLACGTGRHLVELARLGYRVDGSDVSAHMVAMARERSHANGLPTEYFVKSFQTCGAIPRKYDVVLALFAAINYLTTYEDMAKTLKNIGRLLKPGGVFIFDFWNGNAVVEDYSPIKEKRVSERGREVVRTSRTSLDRIAQIATVDFHFKLLENGKIIREFNERHPIRYFFIRELEDLFKANGLEVTMKCPFMHPDKPLSHTDWNVTFVVKK